MSEIIFIVSHNSQTALISAKHFDELLKSIYCKWVELVNCVSSISCSFDRHPNCIINDNTEFNNLLLLCNHIGIKFVDVSLNAIMSPVPTRMYDCNQECGDGHMVNDFNANSKIQSSISSINQYDFRPVYEMCPHLEKSTLLSDNWKESIQGVGQLFRGGHDEFRLELIKYSTKVGFHYNFDKNNKQYIYVSCKQKGSSSCNWFIRGKQFPITGHFVITSCNLVHGCSGLILNNKTKRLGPKVLSSLVMENVRSRPEHPGIDMQNHMKIAYGIEVPYYKAWRSIDNARSQLYGSFSKSFDQLRWYCEAVKRTNQGSHAWVNWDAETKVFLHAFFAFHACLEAFKFCRPMLFVDGTFMHGRTKATILSAIGKDGNNGLIPVAFAIVTGETTANWKWFLEQLRDLVKHDEKIFYVSDRNTGLLSAFEEVFGIEVNNFYCLYHLHNNLRSHYSGAWSTVHRDKMCNLLTDCAYAPNIRIYNKKVEIFLNSGGHLAKSFLDSIPPRKWAVAHQPLVMRYGEMTSNAAESFNNWILVARALPVTYMVDTIRKDLMKLFVDRRNKAENWSSVLCDKRQDLWNYHVEISSTWFVTKSSDGSFQVNSNPSVKVDLTVKSCSCMQWQIHGFPCAHATAVIMKHCDNIEEVISVYFLAKTYKKCYSGVINPIPDTERFECEAHHEKFTIIPPPKKNLPGRPNKKVCPSCGLLSRHDKLTCINNGGKL